MQFTHTGSRAVSLALAASIVLSGAPLLAKGQPSGDFRKGAFQGRVLDAASGKPLGNATVAIQDRGGKVLAWTQTDADGYYAIGGDAMQILRLRPSRRKGLLARMVGGVGKVVTAPVRVVGKVTSIAGTAVKETVVDTAGRAAQAAAMTAVTGSPAPAVAAIGADALRRLSGKAQNQALKVAMGERQAKPKGARKDLVPGEVFLAVSAPGYKEVKGKAGAYWLEPHDPDGDRKGARAYLEPARLVPAGTDGDSAIEDVAVLLTDPAVGPTMAPPGAPVTIAVKLQTPEWPAPNARVFAREHKKKTTVELHPGANGMYVGELPLDPKLGKGETTITVAALRADPVEVNLRRSKTDPLLEFARHLDDLDANREYDFDPRIMASENRLDITITVLDPKLGPRR